jgi:Rps23 Pro-64 3,4-dihydroxylase Tpa1-like proline 4-hydroxylase
MHVDDSLRLNTIEIFSNPFSYFISREAFNPKVAETILDWLETAAPWRLVVADFYEQYEFSFWNVELPSQLAFLIQEHSLDEVRNKVGSAFSTNLSKKVNIAAHKLIPGQRIRLHNDFIPGQETHRLLIQLNRRWTDDHGGLLMLFNSAEPSDLHKVFRPLNNTALGFAVSPQSYHAVSAIRAEQRFTLVYSFFCENTDV